MEEIYAAIAITAQWLMESSSSSESEEDDMLIKQLVCGKRQLKPRFKNYIPTVLNICSDMDFKSHFRMTRQTMEFLLNDISPLLEKEQIIGQPRMSPKKQLLIAVWTMATPDSYRSICDRFDVGRATAVRAVRHVMDALFKRASTFIKWPDVEQVAEIFAALERRSYFPRVIGLMLQVICDHKLQFIHCYTGQPDCVHDQRIFRLSGVQTICDDDNNFPNNSHIIGDTAYSIQKHLLVSYKDNGHLTNHQKN